MIVKVQPSRKHSSSFKRLREYLTQERDADTGELVLRGDVVLSWNLLSFDTAAGEMQGVASLNDRCKDAVCHYELAWPPGERPTRPQWTDSAVQTLKALGYEDHQYMVVAHDDKKHFHIHIMVNKVHPQTLRAPTRYNNWLALDGAARSLEAKYGWAHTPGMTRWDEESKQAVPISRSERIALRSARGQPTGAAAKLEHYHDEESLQTYVRREVAPSVRKLLTRQNAAWEDLHRLLSKAHLRLEKGESGGYTVLAIDHNVRVKASDVLRNNFAGKTNRQATETALGAWTPASTSGYEDAQYTVRTPVRNSAVREERKAQRHAERSALMAEYNQYRNRRRELCKAFTTDGREGRQNLLDILREQKREIRASSLPLPDKKVLLSQAVAQSVLEIRSLKLSIQKRRQEAFPKDLRSWVADRADEGDARAAAQLRGWRYADQRNQRRLNARLEPDALHLGPPPDNDSTTDWSDLAQQRLAAQQKQQVLANQIAATRIWTINRKTGDVSYMLNGRVSVIDRGRLVTVLNQDEAAIVFGLEMAVQKYGSRIACTGSDEWKRMVTLSAVKHGIFAQFTDPEMQYALRLQRRLANPRQRQQERGGR
ncbi:MAG: TraI/MobA(P) family conjugative relaxase [Terracidiphilus sp.]